MNALSLLSFKSGGKIELNRIEIFRLPRMLFYSVSKDMYNRASKVVNFRDQRF